MVLLVTFLLTLPAHSAKVPITHESLWMMKRVSAPSVSPDGKWVVFTVTEPSYKEDEQVSDLWIAPADGGAAPRRLTATRSGESGVDWSPDGQRIVFTARRDGDQVSQAYLLDIGAGGEAQRVTTLASGATNPQFSPDGRQILFTSRIPPEGAPKEARKYNARVYDSFPIRHWDRWLDDLQARLFVQTIEEGAKARDLLSGSRLAAEKGFGGVLQSLGGESFSPVWTPDGQSIVFVATVNRTGAAYEEVRTGLYQVSAQGGEPKLLTPGKDSFGSPRFSPDGAWLYALREAHTGRIFNHEKLVRFSWPGVAGPSVVSEKLDRPISGLAFSPDSRTVYVTAEDAGLEKIYEFTASGGAPRSVTDTKAGVYSGLLSPERAAKPFLVALWGSSVNPAEVVRIDADMRRHRNLTSLNAARAAEIDWAPPRHFTFTSSAGKQIHNMLFLPPGFDEAKKYPLFVLIHGGPHSAWRDEISLRWNYHLLAQPGYVILATNYTGSTGFGERFAQDIQGDPLKGPGEEINEAAAEAVKRFSFVDGQRQCAGGASYGGHLTNWLQGHTKNYRCLISHAGLINLESQWGTSDSIYHREVSAGGPVWEQGKVWREQNPIRYAQNFQTPILLTVGERDYRVPLNQTIENWSVLQRLKVPSRLIVFPDANHWILKPEDSRYFYQEIHNWLEKYLRK
ncbi:MAG: S9 family peptidase [Bryobacteraceae bacterium]|nr:S9 family peptidase [Bryobacteraceae bacterium]